MCEKKPFDSDKQARAAAKGFAKMRGSKKQRSYFCQHCRAWHLTTEEPEGRKKKKGKPYERQPKNRLREGRHSWQ